jgi:hypothetical protein
MSDKTRDIVTGIVGFTACMLVSIMWYHVYVAPHDAARRVIMDCMADNSPESYQDCYNKLNPRK